METKKIKVARELMVEAFLSQHFRGDKIREFVKKNKEKIKKLLIFEAGYYENMNNMKAKFLAILSKEGIKLDKVAFLYIILWDYCVHLKFREAEKAPKSRPILEDEADKEAMTFVK